MFRKLLLIAAILLGGLAIGLSLIPEEMPQPRPRPTTELTPYDRAPLIAHAGGGLREGIYTNSLQALDQSAALGFTLIEVDFVAVGNGELVLLHDWETSYVDLFGAPDGTFRISKVRSPTDEAFRALQMRDGLTAMTLRDLVDWLARNPGIRIVTDIKGDTLGGLQQISEVAGVARSRFIPQIYRPRQYAPVRAMGFDDIIFTNYRHKIKAERLGRFMRDNALFALTLPPPHLEAGYLDVMGGSDVPVYTHTFNTPEDAERYIAMGADGFYTDFLHPVVADLEPSLSAPRP